MTEQGVVGVLRIVNLGFEKRTLCRLKEALGSLRGIVLYHFGCLADVFGVLFGNGVLYSCLDRHTSFLEKSVVFGCSFVLLYTSFLLRLFKLIIILINFPSGKSLGSFSSKGLS